MNLENRFPTFGSDELCKSRPPKQMAALIKKYNTIDF